MIMKNKCDVLRSMERILEEFNFKHVHEVMKKSNWVWCGEHVNFESHVPTIKEMRLCAKDLLRTCVKNWINHPHKMSSSTGGFVASITKKGRLSLAFVVEEMTSYDIEEIDDCDDYERGVKSKSTEERWHVCDDTEYADYID
jgi:hypothetical protein